LWRPAALFPATSDSEKISFNQTNRNTEHRIKFGELDAYSEAIKKRFKVDTDTCVEIGKDKLAKIALESTRNIEIGEFVPKARIDPRYPIRP
jgi:DNA end-binding protein Ku